MEIRCNICDEVISASTVDRHIASRDHVIKRKVAEFNEMNSQIKISKQNDSSVVNAWIRDLYKNDFLSMKSAQA